MPRFNHNTKMIIEQTMRKGMRDAVCELIADKELNAISIADVAKKMQVSSVTVYNYYASRAELIDDAVNESRRIMMEKMVSASEKISDPEERIMTLGRIICEDFEAHKALFMARFSVEPQSDESAFSAKEYFETIIGCFADAVSSGIELGIFRNVDARYAAMSFLGALMSFNRHAVFKWIELGIDERLNEVKNIIINGLKIKELQK